MNHLTSCRILTSPSRHHCACSRCWWFLIRSTRLCVSGSAEVRILCSLFTWRSSTSTPTHPGSPAPALVNYPHINNPSHYSHNYYLFDIISIISTIPVPVKLCKTEIKTEYNELLILFNLLSIEHYREKIFKMFFVANLHSFLIRCLQHVKKKALTGATRDWES